MNRPYVSLQGPWLIHRWPGRPRPSSVGEVSLIDHEDLLQRVQKSLDAFLAAQRPQLDAISPELAPLADALTALVSGGKRLRPAFCFWGHLAAGGTDSDALVDAATSLELFQACALIHDDVMDGSDTRRGQPAVHRRFAALHRSEGWHGDPEGFGAGAAILLGDLCLSWSDQMLATSGLAPDLLAQGTRVYDEMRSELMAGQYLDLLEQARGGGSIDRAMAVLRYKSAKYTIEKPLHLGAALAGRSDLLPQLTAYGLPLGEAFQLRDDVLGVFGDPARTGKPAGDDLREGKRTVLVAMALERADSRQKALVRQHLGDPHLGPDGIAALREVIVDTGALERVEHLVGLRTHEALVALAGAPFDPVPCQALEELAAAATARSL